MPPIRNSPNKTIAAAPLLDIPHGSAQKTTLCFSTRIQSTLLIVLYIIYSNWVPSKSLKTSRFKQRTPPEKQLNAM